MAAQSGDMGHLLDRRRRVRGGGFGHVHDVGRPVVQAAAVAIVRHAAATGVGHQHQACVATVHSRRVRVGRCRRHVVRTAEDSRGKEGRS